MMKRKCLKFTESGIYCGITDDAIIIYYLLELGRLLEPYAFDQQICKSVSALGIADLYLYLVPGWLRGLSLIELN
jgi:hypothetical protein